MRDLAAYFERVVVVGTASQPLSWDRFQRSLAASDWPFAAPRRVPGVDGDAVTAPAWWKQGAKSWGLMMSHARILEDCIREGVESVLVLEDCAVLPPDLRSRSQRFLAGIPADWDQIYFGGQHLLPPHRINDEVCECVNTGGTWCYAVRRKFMPRMYRYILNAHDYIAHPNHGMGRRLGALHESGTVKVYAPTALMVGRLGGEADAGESPAGGEPPPLFIVLGLHGGRANEVAALMKSLGVHFGYNLRGYRGPQMEDAGLADICERAFPFPGTQRRMAPDDTAPLLHDWCRLIFQEATGARKAAGACYPQLCAMHQDMSIAWRHLKAIDVPYSLETAIGSLQARSRAAGGWLRASEKEIVEVQTFLNCRRQEWLRECDHLTVDPDRVASDRPAVAAEIQRFLGLKTGFKMGFKSARAASATEAAT